MKRLICFFDGTWETADNQEWQSNIVRLKRAVPSVAPDGIHQIAHYNHGYAMDGGVLMQYIGAAIGLGLDEEIRDTYRFIAQNYAHGDEIYIFGYSRGAFQARSLAGFITLCGLLDPHNLHMLDKAWDCYMRSAGREEDHAIDAIRSAGDYPVEIQCLGVFDTVGNLGVPGGLLASAFNRRFAFHNTGLHKSIRVGLHALSIDEFRSAFRPSLWTMPEGTSLPAEQVVEQVWFPGTHGDVGGGFPDRSLSDGALLWMADRLQFHTGLVLNNAHLSATTAPDPLGPQFQVSGPLYHFDRLFPFVRVVGGVEGAVSNLRRKLFRRWRIGVLPPRQIPINEDIHDSAILRYGKSVAMVIGRRRRQIVYKPANLMAVIRRQAEQDRQERWEAARSAPIVLKRRQILRDAVAKAPDLHPEAASGPSVDAGPSVGAPETPGDPIPQALESTAQSVGQADDDAPLGSVPVAEVAIERAAEAQIEAGEVSIHRGRVTAAPGKEPQREEAGQERYKHLRHGAAQDAMRESHQLPAPEEARDRETVPVADGVITPTAPVRREAPEPLALTDPSALAGSSPRTEPASPARVRLGSGPLRDQAPIELTEDEKVA